MKKRERIENFCMVFQFKNFINIIQIVSIMPNKKKLYIYKKTSIFSFVVYINLLLQKFKNNFWLLYKKQPGTKKKVSKRTQKFSMLMLKKILDKKKYYDEFYYFPWIKKNKATERNLYENICPRDYILLYFS